MSTNIGKPKKVSEDANAIETYKKNVEAAFAYYAPTLKDILPRHITARQVTRYVVTELLRDQNLQKCTPSSLALAAIQAAIFGVEPSNVLGYGYLVPYGNQATFIPGYLGFIKLGRQHPDIADWQLHCVYEKDKFEIQYGTENKLFHVPFIGEKRGEMIGAYSVVWFNNGRSNFLFMPKGEIEKRKKFSRAAKSSSQTINMWRDFPDQAYMKTAVRSHAKTLPRSTEIDRLLEYDNSIEETGKPPIVEVKEGRLEIIPQQIEPVNGSGDATQLAERLKQKVVASKTPATQRQPAPAKSTGENHPDTTGKPKKVAENANTAVAPSEETEFVNNWKEQPFDVLNEKYMELRESTGLSIQKAFSQLQKNASNDDPVKKMKNTPPSFKNLYEFSVDAAVRLLYWMKEN